MRIKHVLAAAAVAGGLGVAAAAPGGATAAGTAGPWAPLPQGPCSPGGIFHPDPGWPGRSGWCEYPKKKKCWWTCPRKVSATSAKPQPADLRRI